MDDSLDTIKPMLMFSGCMTVYSHSRLRCFEQCPARFKFQYIDKVETTEEQSVEAFLGTQVHECLEKLYRDLQHQKEDSLEELLAFLDQGWKENWSGDIILVSDEYGPETYQRMARKYLSDYYKRYHPFTQERTVALEERVHIRLDNAGMYQMQGYIDRLSETTDGDFEIHDYKTNSRLPLTEYLMSDRQLALYMIGVQDSYPDVRSVQLVWHFLKFDKEVRLSRSSEELAALKKETMALIDRIEGESWYKASPGVLCEWCEYQKICRQWSHLYKVKEKPANEYLKDSGVVLVNRYAEVKQSQKQANLQWDLEMAKLEEALLSFAEKERVEVVFGSKNKVRITQSERLVLPNKNSKERERLEEVLRKYGKFEEVSQLDTAALGKIIQEKQWAPEVLSTLQQHVEWERKQRLYLSKLKK
jgi:putative RecB family exonuclease